MRKVRVLVAAVGAALALGAFAAPAQAKHICITSGEGFIHDFECNHSGWDGLLEGIICFVSPTCF